MSRVEKIEKLISVRKEGGRRGVMFGRVLNNPPDLWSSQPISANIAEQKDLGDFLISLPVLEGILISLHRHREKS